MMYNWFVPYAVPLVISYTIALSALAIGSITDIRTREVPDWVNYGLIISGISLNLLFSAIYSNPSFIINSIVGLIIFFGIAYIMFYAGQWGGGDSKMLMGLGAIIGIDISIAFRQFLIAFLVNTLFIGAVYGLFWSLILVFKHKSKFWKEFKRMLSNKTIAYIKNIILLALVALIIPLLFVKLIYFKILILSVAFLILTTFYIWIFVKSIEKSCMHKLVEPSQLTEGDWIVKDVFVGGNYITGPKDLGISKSKIRKLIHFYKKKKVKKILIKEGIPFVPSFLIAFLVTLFFGNLLLYLF